MTANEKKTLLKEARETNQTLRDLKALSVLHNGLTEGNTDNDGQIVAYFTKAELKPILRALSNAYDALEKEVKQG